MSQTYRLYVIWDHALIICLPSICGLVVLLGAYQYMHELVAFADFAWHIVGGIGCCVQFARLRYLEIIYTSDAQPWVISTLTAGAV